MERHRVAEERSISYHRVIAEKLLADSEVLAKARRRVESWLAANPAPFYARKWSEVLAGDAAAIASFLVEQSDLAAELRHSSPFAGALSPQERWAILRETQERFSREQ